MGAVGAGARHVGIVVRHRRGCASERGARCNCLRSYQASVWSAREGRRMRKHFSSLAGAKAWRAESYARLRRRDGRRTSLVCLAEAAEQWLAGVRAGVIRTRSGDLYKPSAIRSYQAALHGGSDGSGGLLRALGRIALGELTLEHVQGYADGLLAAGAQPSTIRNAVMPLRAILRWRQREVPLSPMAGLRLPAVRSARAHIVSPPEAERLLAALAGADRPLWATALYAGLRRGELMGLRWGDVDLARGVLHVRRAWDPKEHEMVAPKSRAGARRVPIASVLRVYLAPLQLAAAADPRALVFGVRGAPFSASSVCERARRAWRAAALEPICLHDCRHTFASLMIAAGVNAKALSTYMGHANISITLDRYGHLMPGAEEEAAALMDAYLAGSGSV